MQNFFGGLFMGKKERLSLRKYKVGLVSVLIVTVFLAGHVAADEVNSAVQLNQVGTEQVVQVVDSSQAVDETQVELATEQTSEVSSQTVNQDGLNLSDNQEVSLPTENEVADSTQDKISTVSIKHLTRHHSKKQVKLNNQKLHKVLIQMSKSRFQRFGRAAIKVKELL